MAVALTGRARSRASIGAVARQAFWSHARARMIRKGDLPSIPEFRLFDTEGRAVTHETISGRPTLLVFSSPHCGPCSEIYPVVAGMARKRPDLNVILVSRGARATNSLLKERYDLGCPVVGARDDVDETFGVTVVPYAALVSADGRLVVAGATSNPHLSVLAERTRHPLVTAGKER